MDAKDIQIANLKRVLSTLTQQQRIDAERLALAGDVQSEVGRGTASSSPSDLMRRQAKNEIEALSVMNSDEE